MARRNTARRSSPGVAGQGSLVAAVAARWSLEEAGSVEPWIRVAWSLGAVAALAWSLAEAFRRRILEVEVVGLGALAVEVVGLGTLVAASAAAQWIPAVEGSARWTPGGALGLVGSVVRWSLEAAAAVGRGILVEPCFVALWSLGVAAFAVQWNRKVGGCKPCGEKEPWGGKLWGAMEP